MTVQPIPDNYPRLTPYLAVKGAAEAIEFYCDVLGFTRQGDVMVAPDGRIGHAELQLGESLLMLSDEWPEADSLSPDTIGGSPVLMNLYVSDVDATYQQALEAGATSLAEPEDQFYGDRSARFVDPWGHRWNIASHVEDVDPEEMERRATAAMGEVAPE
ncbi:MAG: VOC family protein [Microthrixaceae bacterium]|nr:VOC family protein [Microthrixaceae bacterium]